MRREGWSPETETPRVKGGDGGVGRFEREAGGCRGAERCQLGHFMGKGPLLKRFGLFRGTPLAMTDTQIKSFSNYQMKMHTEGLLRVDVSHDFENV